MRGQDQPNAALRLLFILREKKREREREREREIVGDGVQNMLTQNIASSHTAS